MPKRKLAYQKSSPAELEKAAQEWAANDSPERRRKLRELVRGIDHIISRLEREQTENHECNHIKTLS